MKTEPHASHIKAAILDRGAVIVECDQRDAEWYNARLGIPTASRIDALVTPKGKARTGAGVNTYRNELLAERITGEASEGYVSFAMRRGIELEPDARNKYAVETGRDVQTVGFVFADASRRCGCSPDGLCTDRGLEVKCPMRSRMIELLLLPRNGPFPEEHVMQVQFGMWVTGLPAWDLWAFTPEAGMHSRSWTIEADPVIHAAFAEIIPAFCDGLDAAEAVLIDGGCRKQPPKGIPTWAMPADFTPGEDQ